MKMSIMNIYFYVIPLFLGLMSVMQATLNRQIASVYGLISATLLNAAIFFILAVGLFALAWYSPKIVPEFLQIKDLRQNFSLLYIFPAICGFIFVVGMPWSLVLIGPSNTFLLLIGSQVLCSLALEVIAKGSSPNIPQILGAILISAGATLIIYKS